MLNIESGEEKENKNIWKSLTQLKDWFIIRISSNPDFPSVQFCNSIVKLTNYPEYPLSLHVNLACGKRLFLSFFLFFLFFFFSFFFFFEEQKMEREGERQICWKQNFRTKKVERKWSRLVKKRCHMMISSDVISLLNYIFVLFIKMWIFIKQ